ncbi:MAG: hypothetical protein WDW38_010603 [Sanguina aurantia]
MKQQQRIRTLETDTLRIRQELSAVLHEEGVLTQHSMLIEHSIAQTRPPVRRPRTAEAAFLNELEEFEYKKWLRQGTLQSQRVELVKLRGQRVLMQKQLLEIPLQLAKAKDPAAHAASGLVFLSRMQSSNWSGNVERAVNVATANRLLFPRSSDGDRHTAAGAQPSPALLKMLSWEQTPGCVAVTEALLRDNHSPSDGNKVAASVLQALRRLKRQRGVQSVDTRVLAHCISLAGTIRKVLLRAPHSTAPHPSNVKAIGASLLDAVTHLSCIRPSYGPKIGGALHGRNIDSYEGMYVSSQGCTLTASPASVHKAHLQQRLSLVLLATFVQERNRGVRALGSGNCTQRCLDCSDMGVKVLAMRAGLARSVFESMLLLYGSAHGDAQAEAEHGPKDAAAMSER